MTKNQSAVAYAVANAVLALFAQQVASGIYPMPEAWRNAIGGLAALAIAGLTAVSPYVSRGHDRTD